MSSTRLAHSCISAALTATAGPFAPSKVDNDLDVARFTGVRLLRELAEVLAVAIVEAEKSWTALLRTGLLVTKF